MTNNGPGWIQKGISAAARAYVNYLPNWRGKLRPLRLLRRWLVVQVRPNVWIHVDPRIEIEAIKPGHRASFPKLADCAISPLLTHDWYQRRFPRHASHDNPVML